MNMEGMLKSDRLCGFGYSFIQITVFIPSVQSSAKICVFEGPVGNEKCVAFRVLGPQICISDAVDGLNLMMCNF